MSYIDERCTCCGQRKPEEPKIARPKVEKLLPYPQDVTVPRERCSFCGAEGISRLQGRNGLIHFCGGCAYEVAFAFVGCGQFADPIERNEKVRAIVIERQARDRKDRGADAGTPTP